MISVSGKKWIEKQINKNSIEKIKQDFNFSEIISKLIINRNFDYNEIYSIEKPSFIINKFKKATPFFICFSPNEGSKTRKIGNLTVNKRRICIQCYD